MKINLDTLIILDALANYGSLAAAAATLHKTPAALSYMVQKLEVELGITLLDRSGHRAKFTDAGELILEKSRMILQATRRLEKQAAQLISGWENEITVALDGSVPFNCLIPLIDEFYQEHHHTQLTFIHQTLGGSWESLTRGCADIILGAITEPPVVSGYTFHVLGSFETVFVVSPDHPLASFPEPLEKHHIQPHRGVVVRDTSRVASPRNVQIPDEQDVLVVFDFNSKLQAQLSGLVCGYLPRHLAQPYIDQGQLVIKKVASHQPVIMAYLGHDDVKNGKAALWWRDRLLQGDILKTLYQH
ncbi:LysR substrate-binding domain-containing protein [Edaphovirga cremea]|uniref:LysR substrate-binding domain-containing protein n=1 Tax=Edaphovirga cremea TaxID=2267246 RepID=UPI000DEEB0E4|nr:LysR substrate-binding domain-containing protein [Edaphovirga cremea]